MFQRKFFITILISIFVGSLSLTGCSWMPWSSEEEDEDLFFEEDFGSEFDKKAEEKPAEKSNAEDDFFKTDQVLAETQSKADEVPAAPDEEDFFFEDEKVQPKAKPKAQPETPTKTVAAAPKPQGKSSDSISQDSGMIGEESGFVSIDQKTDRDEFKIDVATLHKQQEELMFRVQELQKIVGNLEPRLTATQEKMAASMGSGTGSQKVSQDIEALKMEIARLKNEIAILKRGHLPSKQAKVIQKTRPSRRYPKLSRTPKSYNQALAAYRAGKYDESILMFQELSLKNPPENLKDNIHFWIGSNYMKLDMYDDAIQQFQTVLKQYPRGNKIHDSRFMLGVCYQKKGDTGRALDALEVALKGNPPSDVRQKIERQLMEIK